MLTNTDKLITRRQWLQAVGSGIGTIGMASVMGQEKASNPFKAKPGQFLPKAKSLIHICINGGLSQVDSFDPKPLLEKWDGKALPRTFKTEFKTGGAYASRFKFKKYGQSGMPISNMFPHLGQHADDICVIRSMHTDVPNHEPGLMMLNTGDNILPRPSMGSWINYGLGSSNQNLPGYIVLSPGGYPVSGAANWRSSFLPGIFQGTYIDTKNTRIDKLIENIRNRKVTSTIQRKQIDLLSELNAKHLAKKAGEAEFDSRMKSYELAYNMQLEATDAFDLSKEPQHILDMYGKTPQCRQLLMARRLVERGVRCVQLFHAPGNAWDHHFDIDRLHAKNAAECSQGVGALITDLKQRGLLDDTLILFSGEFGRTPVVEMPRGGAKIDKNFKPGRDHNHHGFSCWLAGGGVKGGHIHGSTDEFGFEAVEDKVHVHDLHATILKLLGIDHEELTYRFSGRDFRLTDVEGYVVNDIIA
ncbi:MAG: DUF1501 domain-containing protein [Lentisphaeraceae bacterium]|nr:DUF1501 domain-containing protein [Lentisphaeraceae bacterium]